MGEHNLSLYNRSRLQAEGVRQVISYDDHNIVLVTDLGTLVIKGENLSVNHLDLVKGDLVIEGKLVSLVYSDSTETRSGKGLLQRVFK